MSAILRKVRELVGEIGTGKIEASVTLKAADIFAPPNMAPRAWQIPPTQNLFHPRQPSVEMSEDLARILALPRRPPKDLDGPEGQALSDLMTARLARHNPKCICTVPVEKGGLGRKRCITRLKPTQAWALFEAPLSRGLLGLIGVGHGKTGLDILTPLVMPNVRNAVLLLPPGLVNQLIGDYHAWAQHFRVPSLVVGKKAFIVSGAPTLHVIPFSLFSQEKSTTLLEQLRPSLIIADEGHRLRHPNTATTGRVLRYFSSVYERGDDCMLCVWSGTLTGSKLEHYAHLAAIALGEGSPLPLDPSEVTRWGNVLNPVPVPAPMGELRLLCRDGEHVREGFGRRLLETRGVIATKAAAVSCSLSFHERKPPKVPDEVREKLAEVRDTWVRPDGEELVDLFAVHRCLRELACGFFYRWRYPNGEPEDLIREWLAKRKAWRQELRAFVKNRLEHLDSELLATKAAIRFHDKIDSDLPKWDAVTFPEWREVAHKVKPVTEAVWVSDYLAEDAASWAKKNLGIVWYDADAFGERLAKISGLPKHGGGPDGEERIRAEKGDRSIVASIKAHGTGRDGLQYLYREQLVACPPASGDTWEQLVGRLHREGQTADEVVTHVYRHTEELRAAIDKALEQARYVQGTTRSLQKLLISDVTF